MEKLGYRRVRSVFKRVEVGVGDHLIAAEGSSLPRTCGLVSDAIERSQG